MIYLILQTICEICELVDYLKKLDTEKYSACIIVVKYLNNNLQMESTKLQMWAPLTIYSTQIHISYVIIMLRSRFPSFVKSMLYNCA